jgi:hypothetical protein|tara:strand:- start:296 stop:517 length:222 start_codon:yes stop_codon:yes gene_type:complete
MEKTFTYTIPEDTLDKIVKDGLKRDLATMDEALERYKDPEHGYIAMFETDKEEDIRKIRKMRNSIHHVLTKWY